MSEAEVSAMVRMSCLRDWKFKSWRDMKNLGFDRSLKLELELQVEESDRRHGRVPKYYVLDNSSW